MGQKYKTLNVLNELGLSWKSEKKKHFARDSINQARPKVTNTSTTTRFQLYINAHTLSESKQDLTLILIMVCQHYTLEF